MAPIKGSSRPTGPPEHRRLYALVTRPRDDAATLVAALAARGISAIVEPLLEIAYRDAPPPDLAQVQAVLCTSANGVRALGRLSRERGVPLFAVGEASAAAARAAGFAQVASAGGNVNDLVTLVGARLQPDGGRLLHVAGSDVTGNLASDLRERGFALDRVVLYEARQARALSGSTADALSAGSIDVALFFSPRTAAIFVRLVETADIAVALHRVTAVSISAAADAALAALPFHDRLVAARPDAPAMLAALDRAVVAACPA